MNNDEKDDPSGAKKPQSVRERIKRNIRILEKAVERKDRELKRLKRSLQRFKN